MNPRQTAEATPIEPTRIFIASPYNLTFKNLSPRTPPDVPQACLCCKARKRRCDGGTPNCANCVARGVQCNYAAVRKTRGPAKRKNQHHTFEERANTMQHLLPLTLLPDDISLTPDSRNDTATSTIPSTRLTNPRVYDEVVVNKPTSLQSTPSPDSSQTRVNTRNRIPIFPDFLLPGAFDENLRIYKIMAAEGIAARNFKPLMPLCIARRLVENSFAEIMEGHQLIPLSHFMTHLDAQYAASSLDPAGNPARWAVVNTIVALGIRSKTAPGSEAALFDITNGFYRNATKVVPELILQRPCLASIQALLGMALFARDNVDISAFIMLASNASRQLELLSLNSSSTSRATDKEEMEQYEQVYRTADMFEKNVRELLGTKAALCQGQAQLVEPQSQLATRKDTIGFLSDMI